jgi:hypothetical protein
MNNCLVVYASMSQVKRVKSALEKDGGYVDITRTPHCVSTGGCSTAIRCKQGQLVRVVLASAALQIPVQGAYAEESAFDGPVYRAVEWEGVTP